MSDKNYPVIVIRAQLNETWGTREELEEMTEQEIIDLALEDIDFLFENAKWEVQR